MEIGSIFELDPEIKAAKNVQISMENYGIYGSDRAFFSSGRGAEGFIIDLIEKRNPNILKKVLLPSFTCHTVFIPFEKRGYEIIVYPVSSNLYVDIEKFKRKLAESDAQIVLVHRYFGFDTFPELDAVIHESKKREIYFIEDRTQCLYSLFRVSDADYIIGSFRKWGGLPDGGYAVCKEGSLGNKPQNYDVELEKKKLWASYMKYEYLHKNTGSKPDYLNMYKEAEALLEQENVYYKISPMAETVLDSMNIESMRKIRRDNYKRLYNALHEITSFRILTPQLDADAVPFYLAVSVADRESLQRYLIERNIYTSIIWPKFKQCPPVCVETDKIYKTILCFPIDQRYTSDDMDRIARCVRQYIDSKIERSGGMRIQEK